MNLFLLCKKNEARSYWRTCGKMFWSLDLFFVSMLSRSSQPEANTEVELMEERAEVYWVDIWNMLTWIFFTLIYLFACCNVDMLALMKAAFTQMLEMSLMECLIQRALILSLLACSLLSSVCFLHIPNTPPPCSPTPLLEVVQWWSKAWKWSVII